jgi:hypothetical protein
MSMGGSARSRGAAVVGVALCCLCAALIPVSTGLAAPTALRSVRYGDLSLRIPRSWPVIDLRRDPHACVRFNRHALYLGEPSRDERCPAHAVGRTEALLIAPRRVARGAACPPPAALGRDGDVNNFTQAGAEITATWSRAPGLIARALGRRTLPGLGRGSTAAAAAQSRTSPEANKVRAAGTSTSGAVFTGLGFDTCGAPSRAHMSAWLHSPYRAVGIYIGGVNEGCAQPNLTPTWIQDEIASGWHLVPTYVGLQAPHNLCGCRSMSIYPKVAVKQGEAAADGAVSRAQLLGIGAGNPIYYDMEGYARRGGNSAAVLAYLAGWSSRLRRHGYLAGVYSSGNSGVRDLVDRYGKGYPEPNDIWIADWNGRKSTSDPSVPAAYWPNHQRLHQYSGNVTESYGGVRITVDGDYLDGATAGAASHRASGYLLLTSNGGVHPFGGVAWFGSDAGHLAPGVRAVTLAKDRKTTGYWILKSTGGVDNFHAPWYGSLKHKLDGHRPRALAQAPRGGYLILTGNGGVHPFHAAWHNSDAGHLDAGVSAIAIAVDHRNGGYWVLKSNGGVDNFHAPWYGSLKHKLGHLRPVGLEQANRGGYLVLLSDGGIRAFGPAKVAGSDAGKLSHGVRSVSLATSTGTNGYRILLSDGGVNCFGVGCHGSLKGKLAAGVGAVTLVAAGG